VDLAAFLSGTDKLGSDLFGRIVHGPCISLSIGLFGVALSVHYPHRRPAAPSGLDTGMRAPDDS
jgi:hypothetical protein